MIWVHIPVLTVLHFVCSGPLLEDWDIISPKDVIGSDVLLAEKRPSLTTVALPFTQSILSQVISGDGVGVTLVTVVGGKDLSGIPIPELAGWHLPYPQQVTCSFPSCFPRWVVHCLRFSRC